jgi:transposase-like protein
MSPRKLSDADKSDILNLYRHPEETTSTLAVRYGVSNSTISRILKSNLLESEYEDLIQQKRLNRTPGSGASPIIQSPEPTLELEVEPAPVIQPSKPRTVELPRKVELETPSSESSSIDGRRRRKRSSVPHPAEPEHGAIQTELPLNIPAIVQVDEPDEPEEPDEPVQPLKPVQPVQPLKPVQPVQPVQPVKLLDEMEQAEPSRLDELLDSDLMDLDDEDDDLDDEDDDDWEDDGDDDHSQQLLKTSFTGSGVNVQVLPLSEASLPRTCYLVVDRAAELIARPLKEFSDLGQIPADEVQERTLPIFDNHKVARRFSNRSQRVIKVPDSRMLQKTRSHLQAKGITRLLIDGQGLFSTTDSALRLMELRVLLRKKRSPLLVIAPY